MCSSSTLGDLRARISAAFSVSPRHFKLILETIVLPADDAIMLEKAGVFDGARLTVVHGPRPPNMEIPLKFMFQLVSSRVRLGYHCFSSSFSIVYEFTVDVAANHLSGKVIRKSDTDEVEIDGKLGCSKGARGHWMAGSTSFQHAWPTFDLAALLRKHIDEAEIVLEPELRLWDGIQDQDVHTRSRCEGWFVAPSPDCIELSVDSEFPLSADEVSLARVLINSAGHPLRVALFHNGGEPYCHRTPTAALLPGQFPKADPAAIARAGDPVYEEYDVTFDAIT